MRVTEGDLGAKVRWTLMIGSLSKEKRGRTS